MEKFDYKIGGIVFEQTELTWKQDKQLVQLYNKVSSAAFKNEELKLKDLQPLLVRYNLLNHFFGIILRPRFSVRFLISFKWFKYYIFKQLNLDNATNSKIGQIFEDFFLLNQAFGNKLKELGKALGLIATEAGKMQANTKQ